MMKMYKSGLIMIGICMIFSACSDGNRLGTGKTDIDYVTQKQQFDSITFPKIFQYSGNNISANVPINAPEEVVFLKGNAELTDMDFQKMGEELVPINNDTIIEIDDALKSGYIGNYDEQMDWYSDYFYWSRTSCLYMNSQSYLTNLCVNDQEKAYEYNLDLYSQSESFGFASIDEALEDVMEYLEKEGITFLEQPKVYTFCLDHVTLETVYNNLDLEEDDGIQEKVWSNEDDVYLFYIYPVYCDLIEAHQNDLESKQVEVGTAPIRVLYGKNGILRLSIDEIYQYSYINEQIELLPFEQAIQPVLHRYENIMDGSKFEITNIQLCCDLDGTSENKVRNIIPIWVIDITEYPYEDMPFMYEIRINAETGEIL